MAPTAKARPASEGKSHTVLLALQLILVALLVAVTYPQMLERYLKSGGRGGGAPGGGDARRRLKAASVAQAEAAFATEALPPDTVWTPRCQLPEDLKPNHGAKAFVDISVSSEFSARSRRDAIREGYAAYARALGMRVRFFVGLPEESDVHGAASRASEVSAFGDLVVLGMVDTYENLTLKSLGMAAYTAKCGNGAFYVKTDDDVFVYPWRLERRLARILIDAESMYKSALGAYIGNFWVDSRPIRESWHKNYEPKWKGEHFGPYAAGPFYALSRGAVEFLGDNAPSLNWKWKNEDMAMGTWMSGADVEFVNDWHIKILNWKHSEPPLIAEHNIDDRERIEAWHTELAKNFSRPDAD